MGYEIHITRATDDRFANEGHEITAEEWLALIERDPQLQLAGIQRSVLCALVWQLAKPRSVA